MDADSSNSLTHGGIVWRVQSGPMLHLGLSATDRVIWQKSAISGQGRLKPLQLHLAARIDSGRLMAALDPDGACGRAGFLERVLADGNLGGAPSAIVFPRELVRNEPRLLQVTTAAGANPAYATNAFKLRQKISRHFEEFLCDQIHGHSLLDRLENLRTCLPDLIAAWNESGQQSEADLSRRYQAGRVAVQTRLGPDPRHEVDREFRARRIAMGDLRLESGAAPDFHFVGRFGEAIGYCGCELAFVAAGEQFRVSLFSRNVPRGAGDLPRMTDRSFNPEGILLRRSQLPPELRSEWRSDESRPDTAIPLPQVLRAMLARGAIRAELAVLLRAILARWVTSSSGRACAVTLGETQPAGELGAAGITLANESWERIRERHFWRTTAQWALYPGVLAPFARVQIESDGRLNLLPEHPFFSGFGPKTTELLRSLFLSDPDLLVPPLRRESIVATLNARAAERATRRS